MKVVLYGPPLAGKSTRLAAFAQYRAEQVQRMKVPHGPGDSELWHRGLMVSVSEAEFLTVPGAVWGDNPWRYLFAGADAVMVFLDAQKGQEDANREHLAKLGGFAQVGPGCVVVTKVDHVTDADIERTTGLLRRTSGFEHPEWQVFVSKMSLQDAVEKRAVDIEPFEWIIRSFR